MMRNKGGLQRFSFDLSDYKPIVENDLPRLQSCLTAVSYTEKNETANIVIAIATKDYLVLNGKNSQISSKTRDSLYVKTQAKQKEENTNPTNEPIIGSLQIALKFNTESNCGEPTALAWIVDGEVVCVGFERGRKKQNDMVYILINESEYILFIGFILAFNCDGEEVFEYQGYSSEVKAIRVENCGKEAIKGAHLQRLVWIMYECGQIISVSIFFCKYDFQIK